MFEKKLLSSKLDFGKKLTLVELGVVDFAPSKKSEI